MQTLSDAKLWVGLVVMVLFFIVMIGAITYDPGPMEPLLDEDYDLGDEYYHPGDED